MEIQTRFMPAAIRVQHGVERERQIAVALREQAGLPIVDSSPEDDKERNKVDRWIDYPHGRVALQIKYRETGNDLLFEVFDRFHGWGDARNKVGRDMMGIAKEYAVLMQDRRTIVMVPVAKAKDAIQTMMEGAKIRWTTEGPQDLKTFKYFHRGCALELKVTHDPRDGRPKMVAYIPADYFIAEAQAHVYKVRLPANWK